MIDQLLIVFQQYDRHITKCEPVRFECRNNGRTWDINVLIEHKLVKELKDIEDIQIHMLVYLALRTTSLARKKAYINDLAPLLKTLPFTISFDLKLANLTLDS